jgi:Leucine-rich repeat (LRR) protein
LVYFTVSNEQGHEVKQLRNLNKLRGRLGIYGLEYVKSKEEALEANLAAKERLLELRLVWGYGDDTRCSQEVEAAVLEGLCPPVGLEKLHVCGYEGSRYPDWIVGKQNGCPNYLQQLGFADCSQLRPTSLLAFPRLRVLMLSNCNWDALPGNMEHLTSLKTLEIIRCSNIRSLPTLPQSLERFDLLSCNKELMKSCQTVGHPYWQKIEHIPIKAIW